MNTSRELNWDEKVFGLELIGEEDLQWGRCPPGDNTNAWEQVPWIKQIPLFAAKYWGGKRHPRIAHENERAGSGVSCLARNVAVLQSYWTITGTRSPFSSLAYHAPFSARVAPSIPCGG